jgi:hypothetical protein
MFSFFFLTVSPHLATGELALDANPVDSVASVISLPDAASRATDPEVMT